jgi:mannose-1-phosphate guanylyltransferase
VIAAMVLAAGFGTRLRPLTDTRAKALMPVGDRPALAHVLDQIMASGVARIAVNAHHRATDVRAFVDGLRAGIQVSEEPELLGTAGGLAKAAPILGGGEVLVWNADVLARIDLPGLVDSHSVGKGEATLVVERRARGQGPVGVDEEGRIVRLRMLCAGPEAHGGEFLGVSVIASALRDRLPERGCLVADVWMPALRSGAVLRAFFHEGPWRDIGTIESYFAANLAWLDTHGLPHWAGERAQIAAGVSLDHSILGTAASAVGRGALVRCVVWPGASASAPLANAIVTENRVVRVV